MAKAKISEYSATAGDNTDVNNVNIAENCPPSGINNAIREVMAALKRFETGADGDSVTVGGNLVVSGSATLATTAISSADINAGTIDGTTIGGSSAAVGTFTTANATTVDTTNIEVTNIKAKDGTAAATIADSTGVFTHSTTAVFPAGAVGTPSITTAGDTNTGIYFPAADTIGFVEGGAEAMRINSSGNVGIGTSSPAYVLHTVSSNGNIEIENSTSTGAAGTGSTIILSGNNGSSGSRDWAYISGYKENSTVGNDSSYLSLSTRTSGSAPAERMRIDSSGRVLIDCTATPSASVQGSMIEDYQQYSAVLSTSSRTHRFFINGNGTVGSISTDGSATTYATSSDYRLKNTIAPMTGALAKVALLKPCTYKWNADGSDGEGFIAHELAEVVPQCVTGEKDAVDAEGKPVYQGIDTSFLVATLTAAIQELKAENDALKARLDAAGL